MAEVPPDKVFLDRWRAGDENAARHIFDLYVERLVALARRRISEHMASRVDAEDVVQSVFRTFFQRARQGQFTVEDPDDLGKLLTRITIRKTLKKIAYHQRGKRDAGLEQGKGEAPEELLLSVCTGEPSPEEAATFLDQLDHFLEGLKPEERQILALRLEGCATLEVAKQLCISTRKVRRLMERIRDLAEREGWPAS